MNFDLLGCSGQGRRQGRDATPRWDSPVTKDAIEEIAWELGYEGEDYARLFARFEPLARHLGARMCGEFDRGRREA